MGVVKSQKAKAKKDAKDVANGKPIKVEKVKKKKKVSCLQCIKSADDGGLEGKYRVAAPELMQDTFMSDSEDEGGEVECPIQQQQQYRYMNTEAGTLHRAKPLEDCVTDGHLWPSNNDRKVATIDRQPLDIGFLVSFVVDARGGAMKAKRRGGVRIIVPPAACAAPTRVTCRAATRRAPAAAPPPLMEGEALASRLLELQPQGAKFLAPVIIEVPIFTSSCREREIVILRSDTGETWQDHYLHNNDNPMIQEALQRERQECGPTGETLGENGERVTRIVTCDFPHYLAVVSRVRQEVHIIGPEGGTVSSRHIPQVQALFPPQALTKRIRVGVQAHGAGGPLCKRVLPRHVGVSPVITVEPRRRKFHRSITLTAPLPQHQIVGAEKQPTSNLRLLCSIMGGQARAVWEDVTGSTPLTITDDCASFTTTVSARFWLMNCQNVSDATKLATELYREMLLVPFEVRIVVLGKRLDALEGRLLVLYITDRYAYETLLQQEHYTEVAHSTAVQFLDCKEIYLEFSGNLIPVTKSGSQPMFTFEAFKDNRVEFTVRVKHHEESPSGRVYFMNEPKVPKGEQSQTPACVLDVELPERIAPRAGKSQVDYLNLDQSGFDALKDELSFHWGDHNHSHGPAPLPPVTDHQVNGHDKVITNGDVKYPTKDSDGEDKTTKPQVNGDSLHVDSNKIKATFDSDEDKTPMNTLEKGKKKPEGGSILGGLADRVKNVFSHSEDTDEEAKESSPTPQPKPREAKEKSPPKPAPRIINEDLLDKVEDMFKDLKQNPRLKDEDEIDNKVYSTKLVVDEEGPIITREMTEELYDPGNMKPIDTPIVNKTSDPFAFYKGCCDGKFKGQKHTHEETSNLVDRVEHVKFAANEKLQETTDRLNEDLQEGLEKIEEEKDKLQQQSKEVTEDVVAKCDAIKGNLKDQRNYVKSNVQITIDEAEQDELDDLSDTADKLQETFNDKMSDAQSKAQSEIEEIKASAKEVVDDVVETAEAAKENATSKFHAFDFAALERAEELKLRGQDRMAEYEEEVKNTSEKLKDKVHGFESDIKNKTNEGVNTVVDSIHSVEHDLHNKAHSLKNNVQDAAQNAKEVTNEKINDINESVDKTKHKAQVVAADLKSKASDAKSDLHKEGKKKSKEGKNFFTGLVSNIFGEKEKLEGEIKEKISNGKKSAKDLAEKAEAKTDDIKKDLAKKENELKNGAENLAQGVQEKKSELEKAVIDTSNETKQAIQDKKDKLQKSANDKFDQGKTTILDKTAEITQTVQNKADDAKTALQETKDNVTETVENKVNQVQKVALDTKDKVSQAAQDKSDEIKKALQDKQGQVETAVHDKTEEAKKALHVAKESVQNKTNEVEQAIDDKKNEVQQAASTELDRIRQEAQTTTEQIKKSAEDTLNSAADKKTEIQTSITNKVNNIQKSGAEQVENLQSAAGDKLDDLQQSSKEAFGQAQEATLSAFDNVESAAKDRALEAKETWEDLQSSTRDTYADYKDDVHGLENSAQDTLHSFQSSAGNTFDSLDDSAREFIGNTQEGSKQLFGDVKDSFEGFQISADNKLEDVKGDANDRLEEAGRRLGEVNEEAGENVRKAEQAVIDTVASETDKFTSSLNNLGNSVFGSSGKGFMKDSSSKLLESEKTQSSPHKKSSGFFKKLRRNP